MLSGAIPGVTDMGRDTVSVFTQHLEKWITRRGTEMGLEFQLIVLNMNSWATHVAGTEQMDC